VKPSREKVLANVKETIDNTPIFMIKLKLKDDNYIEEVKQKGKLQGLTEEDIAHILEYAKAKVDGVEVSSDVHSD